MHQVVVLAEKVRGSWVCKALNRTSLSKEIEIVISLQVVLALKGRTNHDVLQGQVPAQVLLFVSPFRTGLIMMVKPVHFHLTRSHIAHSSPWMLLRYALPKGSRSTCRDWTPQLILKRSLSTDRSSRGKHNSDNEAVKSESFSEDHHKDKGDQDISLGVSTDTGITDDTNAETSGEGRETAAKSRSKGLVSLEVAIGPLVWCLEGLRGVWDLLDYRKLQGTRGIIFKV